MFLFAWSVLLVGVVGRLRPATFFLLFLVFGLAGAGPLVRVVARIRRMAVFSPGAFKLTPRDAVILSAGALGPVLICAMVLMPGNVAYDARRYRWPLAEDCAAAKRVVHSAEGWFPAAYPQLMTCLHTWAFLLPGAILFDQVGLSAHVEFTVHVVTLFSLIPLTRRLLRGRRTPHA